MNPIVLYLVLSCGTPVFGTISVPQPNGTYKVMVGVIAKTDREQTLNYAKELEASGNQVHRVKIEDQVEGLRCPVST
jgi:hypothetical protein